MNNPQRVKTTKGFNDIKNPALVDIERGDIRKYTSAVQQFLKDQLPIMGSPK
jgi:hypothetical protein